MINTALTLSAWAVVVSVAVFIAIYSKTYSWHKHRLGLVMNLSLISVAVAAIGGIIRTRYEDIGMLIVTGGWVAFATLLIWRLRLLLESLNDD